MKQNSILSTRFFNSSLADWSDSELQALGNLDIDIPPCHSSQKMNLPLNQSSSIQLNSHEFCDNNLSQFSSVRNCSTSWATSIVRIAEHALNNTIHLSVQQLLQCLPSVYGINACQGVNTTSIVQYLAEVGLVEEDQFTSCSTISEMKSFRFAPIFIHSFYELINMVSKKPC